MNAFQVLMMMGWDCKAGHDTARARACMHGKASIEEQTETYADGKLKGLFAAINANYNLWKLP